MKTESPPVLGAGQGTGGPCPCQILLHSALWKGVGEGAPAWDPAAEIQAQVGGDFPYGNQRLPSVNVEQRPGWVGFEPGL